MHNFHPFQDPLTQRSLYWVPPLPARIIYQPLFLNLGPLDSSTAQRPLPCSYPSLPCSSCLTYYPTSAPETWTMQPKSPLMQSQGRHVAQDSFSREAEFQFSPSESTFMPTYLHTFITSSKVDLMPPFLQEGVLTFQVPYT